MPDTTKTKTSFSPYRRWGIALQLGLLVVLLAEPFHQEPEQLQAIRILTRRATIALRDRIVQQQVFQSLMEITPEVDLIQSLRAAGRYNEAKLLEGESFSEGELVQWVKDALTHYWGGPKLTESPLIQFQIVQAAMPDHEDNPSNALRAVLRDAIERIKPEGERRFTSEWILYNILDMKFMEGRKVREIASRLAMSEADLYRKQRIAIEARGETIAMLSRRGCARWESRLDQVVSAKLVEKIERRAAQTDRQWHDGLCSERWTVPIVEVTLAAVPADPPPAVKGRESGPH